MYFIVVKRGDYQRHDLLHKTFGRLTPVVWDRRVRERRHAGTVMEGEDRRRAERRGPAPASWKALNFVVIQRNM
jgi:hypothetical protein